MTCQVHDKQRDKVAAALREIADSLDVPIPSRQTLDRAIGSLALMAQLTESLHIPPCACRGRGPLAKGWVGAADLRGFGRSAYSMKVWTDEFRTEQSGSLRVIILEEVSQ